jgi:hypothetical protein
MHKIKWVSRPQDPMKLTAVIRLWKWTLWTKEKGPPSDFSKLRLELVAQLAVSISKLILIELVKIAYRMPVDKEQNKLFILYFSYIIQQWRLCCAFLLMDEHFWLVI